MNLKIKAILMACLMLAALVFVSGCSGEKSPYAVNDEENYSVSVKFDANGGIFTTNTSVIVDSFNISEMKADGSGKVQILYTEKAKLIASNIKKGITILGVTGTLEPSSSVKVHAKTVTPTTSAQTVLPDGGYDYLSQVTVKPIPYVETDNSAGGKTVTIAGV